MCHDIGCYWSSTYNQEPFMEHVTFVHQDTVIYYDEREKFGVRAISSDVSVSIDLLPAVYEEVVPLINQKVLIAFEKQSEGRVVIGVYSPTKRKWVCEPRFTNVETYGRRALRIFVDSQEGFLDINTGDITWLH